MQAEKMDERTGSEPGASEPAESRVRVREHLITPLIAAGMRKPKGRTVAEQAAMLEKLEERLAYMSAANLQRLVPVVEKMALGGSRNVWPDRISIEAVAADLQRPPDRKNRMLVSYMGSAAGRRAWEAGPVQAVALYDYLMRVGVPHGDYAHRKIGEDAERIRRWLRRLESDASEDAASKLADWQRTVDHVEALVHPRSDELPV